VTAAAAADEPPHPERHPLARMRHAAPSDAAPDLAAAPAGESAGAIEHFTATAATSYGRGHDAGSEMVESFRGRIREQPVKALLVAAGAGFLYGLISRR
jgi:hypothetical protein